MPMVLFGSKNHWRERAVCWCLNVMCWCCVSLSDVSSWREGGGRNLQPPVLSAAPPCTDTDTKSSGSAETTTPLPPPSSSSPSSAAAAQSSDVKEPSLRPVQPAQPVQRRAAPSALQYQHHTTTTYHDMLPAFVSLCPSYRLSSVLCFLW